MTNELDRIQQEIEDLKSKGNKVEDLKLYIDALHKLNEIKDSTDIIIGKVAELRGVTIQSIHDEYGLTELNRETN